MGGAATVAREDAAGARGPRLVRLAALGMGAVCVTAAGVQPRSWTLPSGEAAVLATECVALAAVTFGDGRLRWVAQGLGAVVCAVGIAEVVTGGSVQLPLVLALLGASIAVGRRGGVWPDVVVALATAISWLALAGLLIGFQPYYGRAHGPAIGPVAVVLAFALCICSFAAYAERPLPRLLVSEGPAGMALRRLLPVPFLAPFLFSVINTAALKRGVYDPFIGIWLYALANTAIFVYTIWATSALVHRVHEDREQLRRAVEAANTELEGRVRERTAELQVAMDVARENELRFRHLFHANIVGLAIATEHAIIEANDAFLDIVGYTRQEFERAGELPQLLLTPADWAEQDQTALGRLRQSGQTGVYEKEYLRQDGTRVPVIVGAAQVSSSPLEVLAFVVDNRERKRWEREMVEANRKLAAANEELSQFAFAVSHDLQEPLRQITIFTQLLVRSLPESAEGDLGLYRRNIEEGTARMRSLLRDLLIYNDTALPSAQEAVVCARAALDDALANLRQRIEETGAEVLSAGDLPQVTAHKAHVVQVFQNLIENALKYRAPHRAPRVVISAEHLDGICTFRVADNGIGIDPAYHQKIFGLFRRLHGREIPGTGTGLAICQKVMERYNGHIRVESEPGCGSTFVFTLPAAGDGVIRS